MWNPFAFPTIEVNPGLFAGYDETTEAGVIFHELMHHAQGVFGSHNPAVAGSARPTEFDPTFGCQYTCFGAPRTASGDPVNPALPAVAPSAPRPVRRTSGWLVGGIMPGRREGR